MQPDRASDGHAIMDAGSAPAPGFGERLQLTALCYDLVESTRMLDSSDLEDFQDLLAAFQAMAGKAVKVHGGTLLETLGDGGVAMFASSVDPRDAATFAIETGLEIIEGCRRLAADMGRPELHVRAGVATSMVVIEGGGEDLRAAKVVGVAPALATRLQAAAQPDSVLVSQQTRALARRSHVFQFMGERRLKGFSEPVNVWQAVRRKVALDRFFAFGRITTPMVGRQAELQVALECWSEVVSGRGRALLIEGEAGIGKSRLLHAIERAIKPQLTTALLFQCSPGGVNSTLQPLLNAIMNARLDRGGPLKASFVAEAFARQGIADAEVVDTFCFLLGAEGAHNTAFRNLTPEMVHQKAAWAAQRCVELIGARGPFVLAIEDVHWIDPTSREILAALIESVEASRCLIIMTTRPSSDSQWRTSPAVRRITLSRLAPRETRAAIEAHWRDQATPIPLEWSNLVHDTTGGIPLFIEECCQWIRENWDLPKALAGAAAFPRSSFGSIINSRLEAIGPAKEVAKSGAVIGQAFDLALLCRILPDVPEKRIREALNTLVEAGILIRNRVPGMPSHSFRHALIQEAIYDALLRKARRALHRKIFAAVAETRELASWMGTAMLAAHAERADMIEHAVEYHILAGKESSARSAMTEARQLLDRAIELSERIDDAARKDALTLAALSALGPVLITLEGSVSSRACALYDQGVEIARRRPIAEQATWFPIYWGWWFTGSDFSVQRERAHAVVKDLENVSDSEVQLQVKHCVWAIDFNMGFHDSCIEAVNTGLTYYHAGSEASTLYGNHDPKVCGLGFRGISSWFTGRTASAVASVTEARNWAEKLGHVGSMAHAYDIEAMLHHYRRDFDALRAVIAKMRSLTEGHNFPALAAKAQIFEGWCIGNTGDPAQGKELFEQGLAIHREIETLEDFPVYCDMLAELHALTGEFEAGLRLLSDAVIDAERTGQRYWLAELHHRRARLLLQAGASAGEVTEALARSLAIAAEQNAVTLLLAAYDTLVTSGVSSELAARYMPHAQRAIAQLEDGVGGSAVPKSASAQSMSPCV